MTPMNSASGPFFHKKLGKVMWDNVGMSRSKESLTQAMSEIPKIREEFWNDVKIPGDLGQINTELEKAARVADFLELG